MEPLNDDDTNAIKKVIEDPLGLIMDAVTYSARNLHQGVNLWQEKIRRPVAIIVRFDSISSLERAITFEFAEVSTAISRGYYKPVPSQPRIRPSTDILLLVVLVERKNGPNGNVHEVKISMSFKIPVAACDNVEWRPASYENAYIKMGICMQQAETGVPAYRCARGMCSNVGCDKEGRCVKFKCSACMDTRYHDAECQRMHWKTHKKNCKALGAARGVLSKMHTPLYMDLVALSDDGSQNLDHDIAIRL
eukprot:jgi/Mesvir1/19829/Mv13119-RA.1